MPTPIAMNREVLKYTVDPLTNLGCHTISMYKGNLADFGILKFLIAAVWPYVLTLRFKEKFLRKISRDTIMKVTMLAK